MGSGALLICGYDILFTCLFLESVTEYLKSFPMTRLHRLCFELVLDLSGEMEEYGWTAELLETLRCSIYSIKHLLVNLFAMHCNSGLFMLYFHLLNQVAEDFKWSKSLAVLDASLLKQSIVHVKRGYSNTFQCYSFSMEETAMTMKNGDISLWWCTRRTFLQR